VDHHIEIQFLTFNFEILYMEIAELVAWVENNLLSDLSGEYFLKFLK
jgi:hypothetical protein